MVNTLLLLAVLTAPEIVILNAQLPTVPKAQAMAIEKGKITALGDTETIRALAGPSTKVVDVEGRLVLPGLIDSHIHFMSGGTSLGQVQLAQAKTLSELKAAIAAYAKANPQLPWISGRGWMYEIFQKDKPPYPTRQMLDEIVPDRPVFVRAYDGHTGWANTKALELAGITAETPNPKSGSIVREADGKTPSGALLEEGMDLMFNKMPKLSVEEQQRSILLAQAQAIDNGLVAVNEFSADASNVEAYLALEAQGKLKLRVFFSPPLETPLAEVLALRERLKAKSKRVRLGSLKGFVDGVVESNTAAMLAPYANNPKEKGKPAYTAAELNALVAAADKEGIPVSLHSIGDAAVRMSLDAYENAAKVNGTRDVRHRVEHIEILDGADVARFAKLGAVASMQPYHCEPSDGATLGAWEVNLGKARLAKTFNWANLRKAGAVLAFGSDWPVMSMDPLMGLAMAMSRQNGHGLPVKGWQPAQRISFLEAVEGYSQGAAWALHAEGELGALEVGKLANLIVLDRKAAVDVPLSQYWGTVERTMIDGTWVKAP